MSTALPCSIKALDNYHLSQILPSSIFTWGRLQSHSQAFLPLDILQEACSKFILTRVGHLHVTCWSICNRDHDFWLAKSVLDSLIVPSKLLITWFFMGQRSNWNQVFLILWFSQFGGHFDLPLDWLSKRVFDCWIQFWSWLQMLLHGIKWLPLD